MAERAKTISYFGYPGAGKGTAGDALRFALPSYVTAISPGQLGREVLKLGTQSPLYELLSPHLYLMDEGKMFPDPVVREAMKIKVEEHAARAQRIILDGYPRNQIQYADLQQMTGELIAEGVLSGHQNVEIRVERQTAKLRVLGRPEKQKAKGEEPRPDDLKPEVVDARLNIYEHDTLPVVKGLRDGTDLIIIDGEQDPVGVYKQAFAALILPDFPPVSLSPVEPIPRFWQGFAPVVETVRGAADNLRELRRVIPKVIAASYGD